MALYYKVYLGYIPFNSVSNALLQTANEEAYFDSNASSSYLNIEISNFRLLSNGNISFIIPCTQSDMENLSVEQYNSVILQLDEQGGNYRYYRINKVDYASSLNWLITATPMYLNAVRQKVFDLETKPNLLTNLNIGSKASYIEYGYAYDSIVDNNGRVRFSSGGETDLYSPPDSVPNLSLTKAHIKLDIDYFPNENSVNKALFNQVMRDEVIGWKILYVDPSYQMVKYGGLVDRITQPTNCEFVKSSTRGDSMGVPYRMIIAPIMKANSEWKITSGGLTIGHDANFQDPISLFNVLKYEASGGATYTNSGAYNVGYKIVRNIPLYLGDSTSYCLTINTTNKTIDISTSLVCTPIEVNTGYGVLCGRMIDLRPRKTIPISVAKIRSYWSDFPRYSDTTYTPVNVNEMKTINNPYISLNTVGLKLNDMNGSSYCYSPLQLGNWSELVFNYIETYTPDVTISYVYVDETKLTNSLINENSKYKFEGLISSKDLSVPYNVDKLSEYLANNKNFYGLRDMQFGLNVLSALGGGINNTTSISSSSKIFNSFKNRATSSMAVEDNYYKSISNTATGSNTAKANITNAFGGTSINKGAILTGGARAVGDLVASNLQLDALEQAPDSIALTNGNYMFSYQYDTIGIWLDVITSTDRPKEIMLQQFNEYGIHLGRYIPDNDVPKYISMTGNAFDKKHYKYCKGQFSFYYNSPNQASTSIIVESSIIQNLNTAFENGVRIYNLDNLNDNTDKYKTYNPQVENNIIKNALEDEYD